MMKGTSQVVRSLASLRVIVQSPYLVFRRGDQGYRASLVLKQANAQTGEMSDRDNY